MDFLIDHSSYLGIIVVLILTGSGLPIPEEIPIIAAGVASSLEGSTLNPWAAFASCLIGALAGDCVMYSIGYHFGHNLIKEHPRFAQLLHADREARIEQRIRQHGFKIFFLSRFMVGVRAPVYLAAGVLRISFRRFLLMDLVCASSVVGLFFGISYAYGDSIARLVLHSEKWITAVVILAVLVVVGFLWRKSRRLAELAALNGNGLDQPANAESTTHDSEKAGDEKTDHPPSTQGR